MAPQPPMSVTRKNVVDHVNEIERRALGGDTFAAKTLACMVLLIEGFDGDDPGPGEELPENVILFRSVA